MALFGADRTSVRRGGGWSGSGSTPRAVGGGGILTASSPASAGGGAAGCRMADLPPLGRSPESDRCGPQGSCGTGGSIGPSLSIGRVAIARRVGVLGVVCSWTGASASLMIGRAQRCREIQRYLKRPCSLRGSTEPRRVRKSPIRRSHSASWVATERPQGPLPARAHHRERGQRPCSSHVRHCERTRRDRIGPQRSQAKAVTVSANVRPGNVAASSDRYRPQRYGRCGPRGHPLAQSSRDANGEGGWFDSILVRWASPTNLGGGSSTHYPTRKRNACRSHK